MDPNATTGSMVQFIPIILVVLLLALLILALYFTPTIIAVKRNHLQKTAIILINVLLGWSFIGWVIALIWSVTKEKVQEQIN